MSEEEKIELAAKEYDQLGIGNAYLGFKAGVAWRNEKHKVAVGKNRSLISQLRFLEGVVQAQRLLLERFGKCD